MIKEIFKRRFTYIDLLGIFIATYYLMEYWIKEWLIALILGVVISSSLEYKFKDHG